MKRTTSWVLLLAFGFATAVFAQSSSPHKSSSGHKGSGHSSRSGSRSSRGSK